MADSITCPQCGMTSYNPNDVKERYCGNCNQYHDTMRPAEKFGLIGSNELDHGPDGFPL